MDPYEPNPHLTAWEPPTDPDPDPLPTTSDLGASMLSQTYWDMRESVTAFALAPLLFEAERPGTEVLHPVAVVIFSGLISSTLLDTFLTCEVRRIKRTDLHDVP